MTGKNAATTRFVVIVLVTALVVTVTFLVVTVTFLFHVLFSRTISNLTVEIMAAVLAVVLVVASVGVTIHFQNQEEKKRQCEIAVFEVKLKFYQDLLDCIMESDDDDTIKKNELEKMRNLSSRAALVASKELLNALAFFIERVSQEGQLKPKDDDTSGDESKKSSYRYVIQMMRKDLDVVVVKDDVQDEVKRLIEM